MKFRRHSSRSPEKRLGSLLAQNPRTKGIQFFIAGIFYVDDRAFLFDSLTNMSLRAKHIFDHFKFFGPSDAYW